MTMNNLQLFLYKTVSFWPDSHYDKSCLFSMVLHRHTNYRRYGLWRCAKITYSVYPYSYDMGVVLVFIKNDNCRKELSGQNLLLIIEKDGKGGTMVTVEKRKGRVKEKMRKEMLKREELQKEEKEILSQYGKEEKLRKERTQLEEEEAQKVFVAIDVLRSITSSEAKLSQ